MCTALQFDHSASWQHSTKQATTRITNGKIIFFLLKKYVKGTCYNCLLRQFIEIPATHIIMKKKENLSPKNHVLFLSGAMVRSLWNQWGTTCMLAKVNMIKILIQPNKKDGNQKFWLWSKASTHKATYKSIRSNGDWQNWKCSLPLSIADTCLLSFLLNLNDSSYVFTSDTLCGCLVPFLSLMHFFCHKLQACISTLHRKFIFKKPFYRDKAEITLNWVVLTVQNKFWECRLELEKCPWDMDDPV